MDRPCSLSLRDHTWVSYEGTPVNQSAQRGPGTAKQPTKRAVGGLKSHTYRDSHVLRSRSRAP